MFPTESTETQDKVAHSVELSKEINCTTDWFDVKVEFNKAELQMVSKVVDPPSTPDVIVPSVADRPTTLPLLSKYPAGILICGALGPVRSTIRSITDCVQRDN
jgi:hypothetical protein